MLEFDGDWLLDLPRPPKLQQLDEIREPGCYVHVATGLLVRIFPEELESERASEPFDSWGLVAQLSSDPYAAIASLRAFASHQGYLVRF